MLQVAINRMGPDLGTHAQEAILFQIKCITYQNGPGSGHQSGSESDHSSVMELNEKLLEAHKKVVQQKLNKEVARDFIRVG